MGRGGGGGGGGGGNSILGTQGRTFIPRHKCPLRTYMYTCMAIDMIVRGTMVLRRECPGDSGA